MAKAKTRTKVKNKLKGFSSWCKNHAAALTILISIGGLFIIIAQLALIQTQLENEIKLVETENKLVEIEFEPVITIEEFNMQYLGVNEYDSNRYEVNFVMRNSSRTPVYLKFMSTRDINLTIQTGRTLLAVRSAYLATLRLDTEGVFEGRPIIIEYEAQSFDGAKSNRFRFEGMCPEIDSCYFISNEQVN